MPGLQASHFSYPPQWYNYLEIDITAYGPFHTKYAAVLGAKLALLECIRRQLHPAPVPRYLSGRVGFYVELQCPPLHRTQFYREIVSRLSLVLDDSLDCGTVELENWPGCRMTLSHEFPDSSHRKISKEYRRLLWEDKSKEHVEGLHDIFPIEKGGIKCIARPLVSDDITSSMANTHD